METTNRQYVSAKTLSRMLEVRPETIRAWADGGKIPAIKVNSRVLRFDLERVGRALGMMLVSPQPVQADQNQTAKPE